MNSRPSRNVSSRTRRNRINYAESEEENQEIERSRSPVSPRPPPRRRARITEDNGQETENIVPTSVNNEVVDNNQENQVTTSYMADRGNRNPTLEERRELAIRLNLNDKQVSGWFTREQRRDELDRLDYMRRMGELDSDSELIEYRNRRREERARERESLVQSSSTGILAATSSSIFGSSSNHADVMRRANEEHAATQFSVTTIDQPGTSAQTGITEGARRHRMVLHSSSPLFSDDEMAQAREIGSSNVAVNEQNSSAIEEVWLDRLGDLLRRARQDLDAIRASERSNEQSSTSAPRTYEAINEELDSMRRRFETSQENISRSLWELPPPRRQIADTDMDIGLNDIANTLNARSSRAVPSIPPRNYSLVPNTSSDNSSAPLVSGSPSPSSKPASSLPKNGELGTNVSKGYKRILVSSLLRPSTNDAMQTSSTDVPNCSHSIVASNTGKDEPASTVGIGKKELNNDNSSVPLVSGSPSPSSKPASSLPKNSELGTNVTKEYKHEGLLNSSLLTPATNDATQTFSTDVLNSSHSVLASNKKSNKQVIDHEEHLKCKCDVCGIVVANSGYLKVHKRIHTGEKPYKCSYCDYSSPQSNNVTVHERKHTGAKPFKCSFCEKSFRHINGRHDHEKRKHADLVASNRSNVLPASIDEPSRVETNCLPDEETNGLDNGYRKKAFDEDVKDIVSSDPDKLYVEFPLDLASVVARNGANGILGVWDVAPISLADICSQFANFHFSVIKLGRHSKTLILFSFGEMSLPINGKFKSLSKLETTIKEFSQSLGKEMVNVFKSSEYKQGWYKSLTSDCIVVNSE